MHQLNLQEIFELAVQHHQAGRLAEAEQLYREILAVQPEQPDALHHLGIIATQVGRADIAVELIGRVLVLEPKWAAAESNLGLALIELGRVEEAVAAYQRALAIQSDYPEALNNLGVALVKQGRFEEGAAAYRQALSLRSGYAEAYNNLGAALKHQGRLEESLVAVGEALALQPNFPQAYNNLGNIFLEQGRMDEALTAFSQALSLQPDLPEAHYNRGNVLKDMGHLEDAATAYRRALALQPGLAEAHSNLGFVLAGQGQLEAAVECYRQALVLKPDPVVYNNLGGFLKDCGQLDRAVAAYRDALALQPGFAQARSNLLLTLHYLPQYDLADLLEEHLVWDRCHASPLHGFIRPHENQPEPNRRLRIGYVSADLRDHPVGRFLLPLLKNHDPVAVEVFAYAQAPVADEFTARLRAHTDVWRSLVGLTDEEAAELVRRDNIDILVDLAGHTAYNRLLVFAYKPAPLQVTYLGYPDTSGLSTMDYRLSDGHADPVGQTEAFYSEELIRLDPCAWCFSGQAGLHTEARGDGPITFGCFNITSKVTDSMLRLWGRILVAVPESHLLLKATGWGSDEARHRVWRVLGEAGIAQDRIEWLEWVPDHEQHMRLYGRMDIALDTFPYHGTTTTCEALWMGVPVITLAGKNHVSRVGVSLLANAGHPELVAFSEEAYLAAVVGLARDLPRLAALRAGLREEMNSSPLMDGVGFARSVEAAYRTMWRRWCAGKHAELIHL